MYSVKNWSHLIGVSSPSVAVSWMPETSSLSGGIIGSGGTALTGQGSGKRDWLGCQFLTSRRTFDRNNCLHGGCTHSWPAEESNSDSCCENMSPPYFGSAYIIGELWTLVAHRVRHWIMVSLNCLATQSLTRSSLFSLPGEFPRWVHRCGIAKTTKPGEPSLLSMIPQETQADEVR